MARVKRGNVARKRRNKILALAKGFRGGNKNLLKIYAYGIINFTLSASLSSTTAFVDRCLFNFELL